MLHNYNLHVERQTLPSNKAIELAEVKVFLNINNNSQDQLSSNLLNIATEYAEWYIERSLRLQKWKIMCEGHIPQTINLNFDPINSIDSVNIAIGSMMKDLNENDYHLEKIGRYIRFDNSIGTGKIIIIYSTGYSNPQEIPAPIAIKKIYSSYRRLKITL